MTETLQAFSLERDQNQRPLPKNELATDSLGFLLWPVGVTSRQSRPDTADSKRKWCVVHARMLRGKFTNLAQAIAIEVWEGSDVQLRRTQIAALPARLLFHAIEAVTITSDSVRYTAAKAILPPMQSFDLFKRLDTMRSLNVSHLLPSSGPVASQPSTAVILTSKAVDLFRRVSPSVLGGGSIRKGDNRSSLDPQAGPAPLLFTMTEGFDPHPAHPGPVVSTTNAQPVHYQDGSVGQQQDLGFKDGSTLKVETIQSPNGDVQKTSTMFGPDGARQGQTTTTQSSSTDPDTGVTTVQSTFKVTDGQGKVVKQGSSTSVSGGDGFSFNVTTTDDGQGNTTETMTAQANDGSWSYQQATVKDSSGNQVSQTTTSTSKDENGNTTTVTSNTDKDGNTTTTTTTTDAGTGAVVTSTEKTDKDGKPVDKDNEPVDPDGGGATDEYPGFDLSWRLDDGAQLALLSLSDLARLAKALTDFGPSGHEDDRTPAQVKSEELANQLKELLSSTPARILAISANRGLSISPISDALIRNRVNISILDENEGKLPPAEAMLWAIMQVVTHPL